MTASEISGFIHDSQPGTAGFTARVEMLKGQQLKGFFFHLPWQSKKLMALNKWLLLTGDGTYHILKGEEIEVLTVL